VKFLI